jgi:hypothetical protein
MGERGAWETRTTPDIAAFIGAAAGVFLAIGVWSTPTSPIWISGGPDSTDD